MFGDANRGKGLIREIVIRRGRLDPCNRSVPQREPGSRLLVTHSFPCSPLEHADLNTRIGEGGAGARGNMQTVLNTGRGKLALFASWIDLEKLGVRWISTSPK